MNVILDTSTIQNQMSGTGYYTLGMLRELLHTKSIDTVQTLGGNQEWLSKLDNGKIVPHFPDEKRWHHLLNITMAGNRPNIKGDAAIFPNYFMPPGFSIPSLVTIHDLSFLSHPHFYTRKMRTFYRHRIKHSFSDASRILTVSDESKRQILKHFKRPENEIIPIPPGPSLPRNQVQQNSTAGFPYFLWNGNIEPRKNINSVIKAFLKSSPGNYHFVIAGKRFCKNSYWNEFSELVSQSNRIHYLGYLNNDILKQWYAGASALVYCSYVEGFGIPAANARAMHIPCLISNHPALREAAGPSAIAVNPHNISDISSGFDLLAKQSYLKHKTPWDVYPLEHDVQWKYFSARLEETLQEITFQKKMPARVSFSNTQISQFKKAILNTLAYSAVFRSPIRLKECYLELQHTECDFTSFKKALGELTAENPGLIIMKNGFVGLKSYINPIDEYCEKFFQNNRFIDQHRNIIDFINKIPWIKGLYFSGGTVHATHREAPDLDLFAVTKPNRVWLVYTILKGLAFLTRNRDVLCFNYLIDEQNLQVQSQRDLYTAHQILHLKPADNSPRQPDIRAFNDWIYTYFPNSRKIVSKKRTQSAKSSSGRKHIFMEFLNFFLMTLWGLFWNSKGVKNRTGGIRWDVHQIKLHTHDHRTWVYKHLISIREEIAHQLEQTPEYEFRTHTGS